MAAKSPSALPRTNSRIPAENRSNPAEVSDNTSLQPATLAQTGDDVIRARAHSLWEQAGRPEGDGAEFWFRAEQELAANGYTSG